MCNISYSLTLDEQRNKRDKWVICVQVYNLRPFQQVSYTPTPTYICKKPK